MTFLANVSSTVIDPVSKEICTVSGWPEFLRGHSTQVYSSLVEGSCNTPGNKTPLAGDAEKLKYRCLL